MIIRAILEKEWLELRQQRSLLLGLILPPLLLTLMPVVLMFVLRDIPDSDTAELGIVLADPSLAGMTATELGQAVIGKQFGLLLLLMPVILSSIIAAYGIVGEKAGRTLEPLLATPVAIWELLLAKCLTALIPAVAATWLGAMIFAGGVSLVSLSSRVLWAVVSPGWVVAALLCAPPLALIAVAASVAISSRVNDPRTAQQISAVMIVPLMLVFFAQMAGLVVLSAPIALAASAALAAIAAAAIWGAVAVFQRETILTRWR